LFVAADETGILETLTRHLSSRAATRLRIEAALAPIFEAFDSLQKAA
jgi:hypothetical protein